MSDINCLKRKVTTAFKLCGFLLRSEMTTFILEHLPTEANDEELDEWLTSVTDNLQNNQRLTNDHIERSDLEKAIMDIHRIGLEDDETSFSVIDAYSVPRYLYELTSKKFILDTNIRSLLPKPNLKSGYMRHRYDMLLQKTLRHELFTPNIIANGISSETRMKKFKLFYCENLLSSPDIDEVVIMGLLTQLKEGTSYIEDPTGCVELDLSSARYHKGFFCEGCFILVEGSYSSRVLKADGVGFPPIEMATSSRAFFGTQNSWGGNSDKLLKYSPRLEQLERANAESTIVFLSDVRLDLKIVREKLRILFVGYDSCPPVAIVMMGPFSSTVQHYNDQHQHFSALGALAEGCEELKRKTNLILVPSCDDPTAPNIFPRPTLPKSLVAGLQKIWPKTILATNPCRLQYCTQQITICRLDLMAKFCRNTLHFPEDTSSIEEDFARTLICQGNLVPLHPITMPIHWDYDAVLWLYPLPDLIVIGDSCQSFSTLQHGCRILNTGSFIKSKFSFKVYIPATRTVEDSEIPEQMDE